MTSHSSQLNAEAALGRFIIAFSGLETAVRQLIALKCYMHFQDFMILVEHVSLLSLIDGYKRAYGAPKNISDLFDEFRDINAQRNKIVHAEWQVDSPAFFHVLSNSGITTAPHAGRKKYVPEHVELNENNFNQLIDKCISLKSAFERLIADEIEILRLSSGEETAND